MHDFARTISTCSTFYGRRINRMRKTYRPDLSQYVVKQERRSTGTKRKQPLTGVFQPDAPCKRIKVSAVSNKQVQSLPSANNVTETAPSKKIKKGTVVHVRVRRPIRGVLRYNPISPEWQRQACQQLGLRFVGYNGCTPGGPDVPLTYPRYAR